jgi:endonuclease/exonuclease/phosphatase family metal-dependent hydrolase
MKPFARLMTPLLALPLFACSPAPPSAPTALRVATFNAHDLFDDTQDGNEPVIDRDAYAARLAAIARVLALLESDIVVLQEVENVRVLEALAGGEASALGYAHAVLLPGNDPRGINIGVLSREPFESVLSHRNDVLPGADGLHRYARDCLELHRTVRGRDFVLLAVHLKSKSAPDDPDRRLAEARHTRSIADTITRADPSSAILILGDMNDVPGSPPLSAIEGPRSESYADAASVPPFAWTYAYGADRELIDHQMMSPVLCPMLDPGSVTIPHGDMVEHASDHSPVAATYAFR